MSEGYEITNMSELILPLGIKGATASLRTLKDFSEPMPCIFIELGADGQDVTTDCLALSVQEATWLAEHLPELLAELANYEANVEAEVAAAWEELDGQ